MPEVPTNKHDQLNHILDLRRAGNIRRYHTEYILRENRVDSHSWGVALIIAQFHPDPDAVLLKAALLHDVAEVIVGDIPHQSKSLFPTLKSVLGEIEEEALDILGVENPQKYLTDSQKSWLRYSDLLDAGLFGLEEVQLGNSTARVIVERVVDYFYAHQENVPVELFPLFFSLHNKLRNMEKQND